MYSKITCKNLETKFKQKKTKKLKLLGKGTYGIVFKGHNTLKKKNIAIKFVKMKQKYNKNSTHPATIEAKIGLKLNNLINKKITPHIIRTLDKKECLISDLKYLKTFNKNDWYNNIKTNNRLHDHIKIIFLEHIDSDLSKIFSKKISFLEHKIILFSICYTLTCLQIELKNYRHNDLKPNNIFIKKMNKNIKSNDYNLYIIFGKKYYIPCLKYIIKIGDFDFSYSDNFPNQKIQQFKKTSFYKKGITPYTNPVYDLHYYINNILKYTFAPEIQNYYKNLIPEDTIGENNLFSYFHRLTSYFRDKKYNYIPKNMKSAATLVLEYFNEFKKKPKMPINIINIYKTNIDLNKISSRKDIFNI